MSRRFRRGLGYLLRGYGQLFLCNRPASGLLFGTALLLLSPRAALLGLASAALVTLLARRLCRRTALLRSGLFGVNGVLLGAFWILHTEVSFAAALAATLLGSLLLAAILVPATVRFQRRSSPFALFSLPAVLVFWLLLALLQAAGHADPDLTRGWRAYFRQAWAEADGHFQAVGGRNPRLRAHALDGRGWTAFRRADYPAALEHFRGAAELQAGWADPRDGAGWSHLMLGDVPAAEAAFQASLDWNPRQGSSWDGLGWCRLHRGDLEGASRAFRRAVRYHPFFADPHLGLARCAERAGRDPAPHQRAHALRARFVGTPLMVLPSLYLAAWLLFALGIALHSRLSALLTALFLAGGFLAGSPDINLFYNLAALALALGGAYLVLTPAALLLLAAAALLLQASWPLWDALLPAGCPVLCLPFNLLLLAALLLATRLKGRLGLCPVPLELAATTPERVLWWSRKARLVEECWRVLDGGEGVERAGAE